MPSRIRRLLAARSERVAPVPRLAPRPLWAALALARAAASASLRLGVGRPLPCGVVRAPSAPAVSSLGAAGSVFVRRNNSGLRETGSQHACGGRRTVDGTEPGYPRNLLPPPSVPLVGWR